MKTFLGSLVAVLLLAGIASAEEEADVVILEKVLQGVGYKVAREPDGTVPYPQSLSRPDDFPGPSTAVKGVMLSARREGSKILVIIHRFPTVEEARKSVFKVGPALGPKFLVNEKDRAAVLDGLFLSANKGTLFFVLFSTSGMQNDNLLKVYEAALPALP